MIKNSDLENKVSIIVPIYNPGNYLKECLDSIARQTFDNWKCYLVNDGSTDDSQSIIEEYCQMDDRFVGLTKQNEGSPAKTIQYGLKYVQTDFVIAIGDDDVLSNDYVEKLVVRQSETQADIVVPQMCCFENEVNNLLWEKPDELFDYGQVLDGKNACLLTIPEWVIGMNGAMVRKELMNSVSEGKWSYSDELQEREMLMKCRIVAFSDTKYYYRANPTSLTKSISPRMFDKSVIEAQLVMFAKQHFPENENLIRELAQKHFSGLQSNIVNYEKIKGQFPKDDCKRIEAALEQSYLYTDIGEVAKRSLKWGIAVALLRRFSWYQRLVVSHFNKKNIK